MGEHQIYLKNSDLSSIKLWIKEVEKYQYKWNDPKDLSNLNFSYNVIGTGYHRIVFELEDRYVLKVAITLRGIKSNLIEAEIYKIVPASLKNSLAEVKEQGHGWIIMKKVDHYVPDIEGNREKVLRLQSEFIKNGIEPDDLVDGNKRPKWRNIRLNEEGQITVIDYGNFSILGQTIKRKDR